MLQLPSWINAGHWYEACCGVLALIALGLLLSIERFRIKAKRQVLIAKRALHNKLSLMIFLIGL